MFTLQVGVRDKLMIGHDGARDGAGGSPDTRDFNDGFDLPEGDVGCPELRQDGHVCAVDRVYIRDDRSLDSSCRSRCRCAVEEEANVLVLGGR